MHCSSKKKGLKRCRFERHCGSSSSLRRAKQGKKKIFLPPVFTDFLLLKSIKKMPTKDPHLPKAFHVLEGRQRISHPSLSLPWFLPIKTGEERAKKRKEQNRRERVEKRGGRAKEKRKEKKK